MKILIADDHTLFRESLCLVLARLNNEPPLILQAGDTHSALAIANKHDDIDLILMDIDMPGGSGLNAISSLQTLRPHIPVIMISAHEEHSAIQKALDLGAKGFVPKSTSTDILLAAVTLVLSGGIYLPSQLLTALPEHNSEKQKLTPRQIEILQLLQQGVQNKNIAYQLDLSESTVKVHVRRIFTALGARNRSQAVNTALHLGIL